MLDLQGKTKTCHFLLVEDDDDHAKIVERGIRNVDFPASLTRVKDGEEAMRLVRHQEPFQAAQLPDVILLDLKLPKKDGHEVLSEIKSDPRLRMIPVIILTTSDAEVDKVKAYENYANSYLVKPLEMDSFRKMLRDLNTYWMGWNKIV